MSRLRALASLLMSAIAKSIWFIESQFRQDFCLDDLAELTGLSRFHLSRAFSLTTGLTVTSYLRGRRLTEAARALAAGAPDILTVALDHGYGSHEAFTRAFRDQFGHTPEEVRKTGNLNRLALVEPMPMHPRTEAAASEPRIEQHAPIRIAGLAGHHPMCSAAGIPDQWQRFQPFIGNIDGGIGRAAYGVIGDVYEDSAEFDYLSGVEVNDRAELPPELASIHIPTHTFARFAHEGHVTTLRATIHFAYAVWLPQSGRQASAQHSMLEYYGRDFDPRTGFGTTEIWLGLDP